MQRPSNLTRKAKDKRSSVIAFPQADPRFQSIASLAGGYVIQKGMLRRVNARMAAILGYNDPTQLTGKSFWSMVHPEDHSRVRLRFDNATLERGPTQNFFRLLKKDGTPIWVFMQGTIGRFEGKPASIGIFIDISALLQMNASLQKYWTIINEVEDAVAEVDLKGNVTFANDAGCRIFGHTQEETTGRNYRHYMDDRTARYVFKTYNDVYKTGVPGKHIVYEIIRHNDGQRRIVEDTVCLIRDESGQPTGYRTVSRDITKRMATEAKLTQNRMRLEAIFKSVQDAIITVDPRLNIIDANHASQAICGLDLRRIKGKPFSTCLQHCSHSCLEVLQQTLEGNTTVKDYRIECSLESRPKQTVSVSSSPLIDPQGCFMGAVLVIRDITLLKDLERELRERHQFHNIIGKSKKMRDLFALLEKVADIDTTVLVTGESGTGKELVARALHYGSYRAFTPFVTVNCSALAESLLESELFGHVKGAFTGAFRDNPGRFQTAGQGTILLDEVGDISPLIQLKLLRVLQEREYERVGESIPRKMQARVIASTNADLKAKVESGEFRDDLYYRLKVIEIPLPSLCERMEDVPLLVEHFCNCFNQRFGKKIEGLSKEVLARFMTYHWPGNVRELEHAMERAFVLCSGNTITLEHLTPEVRNWRQTHQTVTVSKPARKPQTAEAIIDALNKTLWNKTKAADMLGISRPTLYQKMRKYQIENQL